MGPVTQWMMLSHRFQLWRSASWSITGTVRVRMKAQGYWEEGGRDRMKAQGYWEEGGRDRMKAQGYWEEGGRQVVHGTLTIMYM